MSDPIGGFRIEREPDIARWRAFVANHPNSNIFHTPEMHWVFSRAARHRPACWAALDDHGCPLALLPVVETSVLDGPLRRFSARAVAYGGALCRPDEPGRRALAALLRAYAGQYRPAAVFTELRHQADCARLQPALVGAGFRFEGHLNYLIDLTQPEEALWRRISRSRRQAIRAAERKGVEVVEAGDEAQVVDGYTMLQSIYARIRVPLPDLSLFTAAFQVLAPRGMLSLLLVRHDGRTIGVAFNLHYNGRILGWYGGGDREARGLAANEVLVWHAIRRGREMGMTTFDFGGAGKPGEAYGPRDYKAKFGGELVNYGRDLCIHAPRLMRVSEFGYRIVRQFL
jgi:CelD/BcsL family acetyltransferase involved in cellulose biosynthesis